LRAAARLVDLDNLQAILKVEQKVMHAVRINKRGFVKGRTAKGMHKVTR
jgi:hypothetical protein